MAEASIPSNDILPDVTLDIQKEVIKELLLDNKQLSRSRRCNLEEKVNESNAENNGLKDETNRTLFIKTEGALEANEYSTKRACVSAKPKAAREGEVTNKVISRLDDAGCNNKSSRNIFQLSDGKCGVRNNLFYDSTETGGDKSFTPHSHNGQYHGLEDKHSSDWISEPELVSRHLPLKCQFGNCPLVTAFNTVLSAADISTKITSDVFQDTYPKDEYYVRNYLRSTDLESTNVIGKQTVEETDHPKCIAVVCSPTGSERTDLPSCPTKGSKRKKHKSEKILTSEQSEDLSRTLIDIYSPDQCFGIEESMPRINASNQKSENRLTLEQSENLSRNLNDISSPDPCSGDMECISETSALNNETCLFKCNSRDDYSTELCFNAEGETLTVHQLKNVNYFPSSNSREFEPFNRQIQLQQLDRVTHFEGELNYDTSSRTKAPENDVDALMPKTFEILEEHKYEGCNDSHGGHAIDMSKVQNQIALSQSCHDLPSLDSECLGAHQFPSVSETSGNVIDKPDSKLEEDEVLPDFVDDTQISKCLCIENKCEKLLVLNSEFQSCNLKLSKENESFYLPHKDSMKDFMMNWYYDTPFANQIPTKKNNLEFVVNMMTSSDDTGQSSQLSDCITPEEKNNQRGETLDKIPSVIGPCVSNDLSVPQESLLIGSQSVHTDRIRDYGMENIPTFNSPSVSVPENEVPPQSLISPINAHVGQDTITQNGNLSLSTEFTQHRQSPISTTSTITLETPQIRSRICEWNTEKKTTELNTQVGTMELNAQMRTTELNAQMGTMELNAQLGTSELNAQLGTSELNAQVGTTELNVHLGTTEVNAQMEATERIMHTRASFPEARQNSRRHRHNLVCEIGIRLRVTHDNNDSTSQSRLVSNNEDQELLRPNLHARMLGQSSMHVTYFDVDLSSGMRQEYVEENIRDVQGEITGASTVQYRSQMQVLNANRPYPADDSLESSNNENTRSSLWRQLVQEYSWESPTERREQGRRCLLCRNHIINTILFNCHHRVVCRTCAAEVDLCPLPHCQQPIVCFTTVDSERS